MRKESKLVLIKAVACACWGYLEQRVWVVGFCLRFVENGSRQ